MGTKYRRWLAGIVGCITVLCVAHASWATVRNVGKSGYPYSTIQSGINAAVAGDTVLVHQGTYYERINFNGKQITVSSVNGPRVTLINGGKGGSVVIFNSLEGPRAVLKGFTITNGQADFGGGVNCSGSSPSIVNCTISGNSANQDGGGIYCGGSSPRIRNCTIIWNRAGRGGGMCCAYSSSPTVADCTINGNSAGDCGGGSCHLGSSAGSIANCTISGNQATYYGGGIFCETSSPSITACTISGNQATNYYGGGICCFSSSSPSVINSTISGNSAGQYGGGIHCLYSSPSITNCTISGNSADLVGGGIYNDRGAPDVLNSILWGNAVVEFPGSPQVEGGSVTIQFSDVQGSPIHPGMGNMNLNPLFFDARDGSLAPTTAGNYRLTAGSPCIDEGLPGGSAPWYDIQWDPRAQGPGIDIGSDEYALLANGSFELGAGRMPVSWIGRNLSLSDRRDSVAMRNGHASFLMNGSATSKQLGQTLNLTGFAGDNFYVYCWTKAQQTSSRGGFFGLALTVYHTDGTTKTYNLAFPKNTHTWIENEATFRAQQNYNGVMVRLVYANQTGKAWFDDVQLSVWR